MFFPPPGQGADRVGLFPLWKGPFGSRCGLVNHSPFAKLIARLFKQWSSVELFADESGVRLPHLDDVPCPGLWSNLWCRFLCIGHLLRVRMAVPSFSLVRRLRAPLHGLWRPSNSHAPKAVVFLFLGVEQYLSHAISIFFPSFRCCCFLSLC